MIAGDVGRCDPDGMRRWIIVGAVACGAVALAAACAKGIDDEGFDGGVTDDAASQCPQYDLTKDPQHCGSCTRACASGEVCSAGACKAQCDVNLLKCTVDGGLVCLDSKNDPKHCGGCATVCAAGDAGSMAPGTGNPDAGIPFADGGFGGPGWSAGSPSCEAGTCGVACPQGMSRCSDSLCYDLSNFHERCGDCNTACAADEWCGLGHCCAAGKMWCNGACTDVLADNANCGGCGVQCSGGTPYCNQGKCVMGCVPNGQRAPLNTLSSDTASGCWNGNPCNTNAYSWASTNGQNFQALSQQITCSGSSTCVGNVGINTYSGSTVCQGSWDVYCDGNKVGAINTVNKTCTGSAMANGCNLSFTPRPCAAIQLVATGGGGALSCCAGSAPDSMITGVSAW